MDRIPMTRVEQSDSRLRDWTVLTKILTPTGNPEPPCASIPGPSVSSQVLYAKLH